jgi:AraC-like DNA-binding protein
MRAPKDGESLPFLALQTPQVPLREWASIHTELHWIYDHEVPERYLNYRVEGPQSENRAWLINSGSARVITASGETSYAGPGTWLFPPRESFRQQFSAGAQILSIHFLCMWPSGEGLFSGRECVVVESRKHPALERRARQLEHMARKYLPEAGTRYYERLADYSRFLSLHTLFLKWLMIWVEVQKQAGIGFTRLSAGDDRVMRAIRCLNNAPLREGYPRDALMRETGLSEAHLNRLFYAEFGMTTAKCWEKRRLLDAKRYLETSHIPIKEIAYSLGFRSDSHFMLWFKKATGKRPTEYRKVHRTLPV